MSGEASRLVASSGGSDTVGVLFGGVRFLAFASLLVLVGGTAFVAVAWPDGAAEARTRVFLWWTWALALATTAVSILLQGPYGGGLPLSNAFKPGVVCGVLHTRFGRLHLARLVILALAGGLLAVLLRASGPRGREGRPPSWWRPAAATAGVALLLIPGLAGHTGVGSQVPLATLFDLIHMGAAAVWLGGSRSSPSPSSQPPPDWSRLSRSCRGFRSGPSAP